MDGHNSLLSAVTGGRVADQMTVPLLWRLVRNTLLTVSLVDLGDGPSWALVAWGELGPRNPGQEPLG